MSARHFRLAPLATLALLASCAYYNGLYNAKDLAHRAEKAEREGRSFDALSLWGQVAVKAETVLVRHPRSRWTDEARFLQGKALERGGECSAAIAPLAQVMREARDPRRADEAALRLAACQERLGDLEVAGFVVERLVQTLDPAQRAEARWRAGVAYRRTGRAAEAVDLLRTSGHPRARGELAAALAGGGRTVEAIALVDSLLAERDPAVPWGAVIDGVGRHDASAASALLDRILGQITLPSADTVATWLSNDGRRLLPTDERRGLDRLESAYLAAPARAAGVDARVFALRIRLTATEDQALLDTIPLLLGEIEPGAGEAQIRAQQLITSATTVRVRLDSLVVTDPQGDLRGFLLGEALRDSLHAPRLAVQLWRRVLHERPDTPYAPKILLAIAGTGVVPPDSIAALLAAQYPGNPYVVALHGGDDPAFRTLEDSLGRFALSLRAPVRPPGRPPARGVRPAPTTPSPTTPVQ